jgi:hypothetical protein
VSALHARPCVHCQRCIASQGHVRLHTSHHTRQRDVARRSRCPTRTHAGTHTMATRIKRWRWRGRAPYRPLREVDPVRKEDFFESIGKRKRRARRRVKAHDVFVRAVVDLVVEQVGGDWLAHVLAVHKRLCRQLEPARQVAVDVERIAQHLVIRFASVYCCVLPRFQRYPGHIRGCRARDVLPCRICGCN